MTRTRCRRLLVGTACAGLAALCTVVLATVAPDTLRAASAQLSSAREQARSLAADVAGLDAQIEAAAARCSRASDSLRDVQLKIRTNRRLQEAGRRDLHVARATLAERAVALYKHDDVSTLDALLGSADFADMVDQLALVRSVVRADRRMLRAVEKAQRELEARAASLAADAQTAERLVRRRDRELATIRARLSERQALLDGTRADIRRLVAQQVRPSPSPTVARPPSDSDDDSGGGGSGDGDEVNGGGPWWPLIEQAGAVYGVSARGLYRLMMVESGGSATVVGPGGYYGLFQYAPSTWRGSWNPYRLRSITDGAAQIRATALAIKLGYGHAWWDPSYSWAFGGG